MGREGRSSKPDSPVQSEQDQAVITETTMAQMSMSPWELFGNYLRLKSQLPGH